MDERYMVFFVAGVGALGDDGLTSWLGVAVPVVPGFSRGTRRIPQMGQSPGLSDTTVGCMGQWYCAFKLPFPEHPTNSKMLPRATSAKTRNNPRFAFMMTSLVSMPQDSLPGARVSVPKETCPTNNALHFFSLPYHRCVTQGGDPALSIWRHRADGSGEPEIASLPYLAYLQLALWRISPEEEPHPEPAPRKPHKALVSCSCRPHLTQLVCPNRASV